MVNQDIIQKCKDILALHYGREFAGLMVFGSCVRDDADPLSDLDLLVILKGRFDYFKQLRIIADILYPIQLESERLISAKPVGSRELEEGTIQLYRNAKSEGVLV